MAKTSFCCSSSPHVNNDIPAGFSVFHSASAAAIFIGCTLTMYCAWPWPTIITASDAASA